MKVKNLLNQPLELDFGDEVVRFGPEEVKTVKAEYFKDGNPVFDVNKKDLLVLVQPKKAEKQPKDEEAEK